MKSKLENHRGHTVLGYQPGSSPRVVDGGAHRGEFATSVFAQWGAKCDSIEADPNLFRKLDVPASTTTHHFAVAGTDGEMRFSLSHNAEASHIVSADSAPEANEVVVPSRSLSGFLDAVAPDGLDLLKLDVEGAEIPALASLRDDQLRAISQITVEFHDFCGYVSAAEVDSTIARLKALDFVAFRFTFATRGDMLFVNRRLVDLSALDQLRIGVLHRYGRGIGRKLARALGL